LKSSEQAVASRTRNRVNTVYIRRVKTMNMPFKFHTVQKATDKKALLDSEATENFVDKEVWS